MVYRFIKRKVWQHAIDLLLYVFEGESIVFGNIKPSSALIYSLFLFMYLVIPS